MRHYEFPSWLADPFQRHVALKRAGSRDFSTQAYLLSRFDRYLEAKGISTHLTRADLHDYLDSLRHLSPRGRDNVVCVVWPALAFARRHGAAIESLPERPRPAPATARLREPFVLSLSQVERLLAATHRLAPKRPYAPRTYATFFGLLYTTGLRVGEACTLDVGDFDRRDATLLVRAGKFRKTRLLPIPTSTALALGRYLDDPIRPALTADETPCFVSSGRRRLTREAARHMLRKAAILADVKDAGRPPRPHDLRHTFAVHRVLTWYREGRDVNALLPVLSTYLGHVRPSHTYTYLRSAELLINEAAQRFERSADLALEARPT
ncbi:MAG: tyrosine-type recombinase/integrase [Planctomycetes bacterium]|nr:tyrosine-type recombinase/integrase [Planctomycetota bacterium]